MTSLLLWKEQLKTFYNRFSYVIQPIIRFCFALCVFLSLNANIGYMAKLKNPLVILLVCLISALLPYGAIVFLSGCLMMAHIYAVSLEMALIALVLILLVIILYYGFKPGDSVLIVLTPLAFIFRIPYAIPLLVGLGGGLASAIPVSCGVFLYYLLMYVKQNAGVLTTEASVDIVQRYSQILKSVLFNQTMMVMVATCAVGVIIVYLIRRLSMDYSWVVAIVAGSVAELLVIFVGDFVFGVSVDIGPLILGMLASAAIAVVYNFFIFTVDYTRTEYVQFEDDDYYYYVKAVPKMTVSTPDVKVQKISTRKRITRERNVY
ncbi:MAG: ABC transporter permease [Clostridium sp.]|nr:ABC transporter permease [Clostridium sp.]